MVSGEGANIELGPSGTNQLLLKYEELVEFISSPSSYILTNVKGGNLFVWGARGEGATLPIIST